VEELTLIEVAEGVAYIPGAVNIGVIKAGGEAAVVDTGLDKDSGCEIRKTLEDEGLALKAIINTHSHADHYGGNDYLTRNLGAEVYAPEVEAGIIQSPVLEPLYLFHGAAPISSLRNRFVMAKPSLVHHILKPGKTTILGRGLEIVPLYGHSLNQVGVLCDGVLFCADAVFSGRVIDKYRVPVVQDVGSHLQTLGRLMGTRHSLYVPSHTEPVADVAPLAQLNLDATNRILENVHRILTEPKTSEEVQAELCTLYGLDLDVVQQYYLVHTTVMAYLGHLHEEKRIKAELRGNSLRWARA
jgi:glyoxylase-like metal-dependent hydrolase (beta-lactamase superfamily II)